MNSSLIIGVLISLFLPLQWSIGELYQEKTECDHPPLVLIHGFLASGDTYEQQALRFVANGFCADRIFTFDWNSVGRQGSMTALTTFIEEVLLQTSAEKIYLAGHSAGSGLSFNYMSDSNRAKLIEAYVHLAGRPMDVLPGPEGMEIRTMNIFSDNDLIVRGDNIPGAENIRFENQDHYQVATSKESFAAMFKFFTGKEAKTTSVLPSDADWVSISGKVLTLGENQGQVGATISIYSIYPETAARVNANPDTLLTVDERGNWGPFSAQNGIPYELVVDPVEENSRSIHYYRTPFVTDNQFVYLRTLPLPSSLAGMMLSGLPRDDEQAVVAIFASQQAVIHGRDELRINDFELSTPEWATPTGSNIAWFLYDANGNQKSDLNSIPTFAMAPFLMGVDLFIPADSSKTQRVEFNGQTLSFQSRKSNSEGIIVLVF